MTKQRFNILEILTYLGLTLHGTPHEWWNFLSMYFKKCTSKRHITDISKIIIDNFVHAQNTSIP